MTYVTKQDLIDRFGEEGLIQLTDRDGTLNAVDDVVLGRAIGDAVSLANTYLAKVYRLPLALVPAALTKICSDLAWYYLHGDAADKDAKVTRDYTAALSWLRDVSKGVVELEVGGETPPQAGGGSVQAVAPSRVFTRDSLRGF